MTGPELRDDESAPRFTIGKVEDITARKGIEAKLRRTRRWLAESREAERLRLARDLHDTAMQDLLDINQCLTQIRNRAGERDSVDVSVTTITAFQGKVRDIISQLRDVIRELRPPGLEEFGLVAALDGYVAGLRREREDFAAIILDLENNDVALPLTIALPLYRAAQESLRNALTHALAQRITIVLRIQAEQATLRVHDDGVGFPVPPSLDTLAHDGHFGLVCMVERVALAGGTVDIASRPGEGTLITVRIPMAGKR